MATDIAIDDLLTGLGLTGELASAARSILVEAGVTNPRKQRIATPKVPLARKAIDARLQRLCHNCRGRAAHDGRAIVAVQPASCSLCGGSRNARAVREMAAACLAAGLRRLVVVGGSPSMRRELADLVGGELELRLVDGTRSINKQAALGDIEWADLVVVLGTTQLAHKVSLLYTSEPRAKGKVITTARRGIEAIADEVTRSDVVRRGGGGR